MGACCQTQAVSWLAGAQAKRLSVALLVALALSLLLTLLSGSGADTGAGRLGGDYPAFYAAGRIAADDGLEHVNDLDHLEAAQVDLFPADEDEGFLTWAYPPHVALVYRPLAALPYRASYAVHTALMVAAFVGALLLARPLLPWLRSAALPAAAAGLAFYPMFRGVGSGQNTALTLLLLVLAWRASATGRDGWAGVALGLLLYKPQFAAIALAVWVIGGRWRALPTFAGVGAATWAITAAFAGTGWVGAYLDDLDAYRATEDVNAANHVALTEVAEAVGLPTAVGAAAALVVGLLVARRWWRNRSLDDAGEGLALGVAVLAPALLLCALHAVFYDEGLVLLTAAIAVQWGQARVAAALWALAFVDPLKDSLDWSPSALVVIGWLALGLVLGGTRPSTVVQPSSS